MAGSFQDDVNSQPLGELALPWTVQPAATWLEYTCFVIVELDPGLVLHKALPQGTTAADTLATQLMEDYGFTTNPDSVPGGGVSVNQNQPPTSGSGVNLASKGQGTDTVQRMATSTYRFILMGSGLRAGYQIPIPGLKSVGGVPAIPDFPQRAFNRIAANLMGGIPVFYAEWELHYMIAAPMKKNLAPVPPNLAYRIRADAKLPPAVVLVPIAPVQVDATIGSGARGGEVILPVVKK